MIPSQLIKGKAYLWVDPYGESRPVTYLGKSLLSSETLYRFHVSGHVDRNITLSSEQVRTRLFRSSVTPL